jgi:hypothetical protein
MVSRISPSSVPRNAASPGGLTDRRDQIIAATLVGTVLVLLGYASGIGGGGGAAQAAGGPDPGVIAQAPSPSASGPAPVIVQATGGSGDSGAPGGYGSGYGYGSGSSGTQPAGGASGMSSAEPSPSASAAGPVIVGAPGTGSPSPSATPSTAASCGLIDCVTSVVAGAGGLLPCLLGSGSSGLLSGTLGDPTGLVPGVGGVTTTVGSVAGSLLGTCPTATATPSAP